MLANTNSSNMQQQQQNIQKIQNFGFIPSVQILANPYGGHQVIISEQKISPASLIGLDKNSPQKCHLCNQEFKTLLDLNFHIKQHVDEKDAVYRNIIASSKNNGSAVIASSPSKDYHHKNTIIHTSDVIKHSNSGQYSTVANINLNSHPVLHQIQLQHAKEREKGNLILKQNPVEYHIQQQEHAAMVVASMNHNIGPSKSGVSNPFLNSTIKYELHSTPPVQIVTEVYPHSHMIVETAKSDDLNSQTSSMGSPVSSGNQQSTPISLTTSDTLASEKQHKCVLCDKYFSTIGNLNIHLKIHAGEKPYKCSVCNKGFIQSNNLATHMKIHTGEKPHKCSICAKAFSQSNNLKTHVRTHTGEKPFKCSLCEKSFNQKNNLTTHLRTHSDYHPSNCSMCGQAFTSFNELFYHMREHTDDVKPHVCAVCNKVFTVLNELNEHMKQHSNPKPYKCDICQKQFTQSNNLKTHIKTHIYSDPYKCNMCSRSFSDPDEYQMHVRVHTVDKPYECSYCGKKFIQSNNLKTHVRTHTGEKPFDCEVCGKSFNQKNNLNTHQRVHTGEKPFECTICDRRFNQSNNLNKHLKTHGHAQENQLTTQMENDMNKLMNNVINLQQD